MVNFPGLYNNILRGFCDLYPIMRTFKFSSVLSLVVVSLRFYDVSVAKTIVHEGCQILTFLKSPSLMKVDTNVLYNES